jgi:hypothetical protein
MSDCVGSMPGTRTIRRSALRAFNGDLKDKPQSYKPAQAGNTVCHTPLSEVYRRFSGAKARSMTVEICSFMKRRFSFSCALECAGLVISTSTGWCV